MGGLSVNTNVGAMAALQVFSASERAVAQTQDRLTTGLTVASARDDGGVYAISQSMRSDVASFRVALGAIDRAIGVVGTALAATEAISDALTDLKRIVLAATDTSLDQASIEALGFDYFRLADMVWSITENASFAGVNLIDAGQPDLVVLAGKRSSDTISIAAEDLSDDGPNLDFAVSGVAPYGDTTFPGHLDQTHVNGAEQNINNANAAAARLGTAMKRLEIQRALLQKSVDLTEMGIGALVDADMAREAASLQAGQVKRDLGVQALSIANGQPRIILSLFQ